MSRTACTAAALFVALAVTGCSTALQPQLVGFKYQRKSMTPAEQAAVSNALNNGSVTLPDIRVSAGPICGFTSNVADPAANNDVDVNGDPHTEDANIRLDAFNDLNRPSNDCPPTVSAKPSTLVIQTDGNIRVGQPVLGSGAAQVEIAGQTFSSRGLYFRFVLDSYDGDYTTGRYEFIAKNIDNPADDRVIIVHDGGFSLDD